MEDDIKILSIGGSIVNPPQGFDIPFLQALRDLLVAETDRGVRFVVVIGGGATARQYQSLIRRFPGTSDAALDWVGIQATRLNAQLVQALLNGSSYAEVATDPRKKIDTDKAIIVAGGTRPGHTTDYVAVQYAKTYGATDVINVSNIDYVYTADPNVNEDAEKIEAIGWDQFIQDIVGTKHRPGNNVPFDPIASAEARDLALRVRMVGGSDLHQLRAAIRGEVFLGTTIS